MKITIEPTTTFAPEQHACTVAHVADDLNIDEVAELIKAALRGYGIHADTVDLGRRKCIPRDHGRALKDKGFCQFFLKVGTKVGRDSLALDELLEPAAALVAESVCQLTSDWHTPRLTTRCTHYQLD